MASKPFVSKDRRIALGELKNLAGFVMKQVPPSLGSALVAAIALRMEAIITDGAALDVATDADIQEMLKTAAAIAAGRDTAYADTQG